MNKNGEFVKKIVGIVLCTLGIALVSAAVVFTAVCVRRGETFGMKIDGIINTDGGSRIIYHSSKSPIDQMVLLARIVVAAVFVPALAGIILLLKKPPLAVGIAAFALGLALFTAVTWFLLSMV